MEEIAREAKRAATNRMAPGALAVEHDRLIDAGQGRIPCRGKNYIWISLVAGIAGWRPRVHARSRVNGGWCR
jgi:hypothetical protein